MQNGQPPFRPPGGMPPFPPNVQPGQMPPFRPNFVPPPFPPNFSPSPNANGAAGTPPPGFRPPMNMGGYPPPRPGLGLPHLPSGMPQPPYMHGPGGGPGHSYSPSPSHGGGGGGPPVRPGFVREVKTTKVFVGSIAPGVTDQTLEELLNACGPLHELKRVSGASGKPQAFGFAAFESPEVVMRTIRCLNGLELPDISPEGKAAGKPPKALVVKVDEKTREFLDEFEQTLGRSEDDEMTDSICRKAVKHIAARLTDPNAPRPPELGEAPAGEEQGGVFVPAHLQDLKEGDLPENQRVAVLDQIAVFREASARRDREKKAQEDERERERYKAGQKMDSNTVDYGYGNSRGLNNQIKKERAWGVPQNQNQNQPPHQQANGSGKERERDPQGYDAPVNFVKAQAAESKEQSDRTDEEEEMLRQQRRDRDKSNALKEKEFKVEGRERQRIDAMNRELTARKSHADWEERHRAKMSTELEHWDDDEKLDRGRELFFTDRRRWRAQRRQVRQREYQDDVRDRQYEEDEIKALEAESEAFLKRQMAEMAELEKEQRARGLLTEDAPMVKLALDAKPEVKKEEKPEPTVRPKAAFGENDDDDDMDGPKRKQRTFVKLDYDESDRKIENVNEAEMAARRNAKLLEVRNQVPRDKRRLWSMDIEWAAMTPRVIDTKIKPFVANKIKASLGEADEDLVDFVLENIRDHKRPEDIIDGLDPVLDEEAVPLAIQLWRLLAFESAAHKAGLDSGTMTV